MPNLAYILSPKKADAAIISGSATVANSSVTFAQNPMPRSRVIFPTGNCFLEWDFGSAIPMDSFFIGFVNSRLATDTLHFRAGLNTPAYTSPLIDSGPLKFWPVGSDLSTFAEIHRGYSHPTVHNCRYARVDISCASAVQIGRAFPGLRIQPEHNVSAWGFEAQEPIAVTVDLGGEEIRRPMGGTRRSVRMEWPSLTRVEALGRIYQLLLERGSARDYMVSLRSGEGVEITSPMHGLYLGCGGLKMVFNTFTHIWSATLELTEMAPLRML
jgi:hypothetical protein